MEEIVVISILEATNTYGSQVVELGLLVYWLEGLKYVGTGLFLTGLVISLFTFSRYSHRRYRADESSMWDAGVIVGFALGLVLIIPAIFYMSSVYHWAAAFGYPKLLISYKALAALGLV